MQKIKTYISLFSSAGIGCYGFKQEGFDCIATVELLERRLNVQKYNHKCRYESGYICGDMTLEETKEKIFNEFEKWKTLHKVQELDVLIATPPCQGMSYINHKKNDANKEMKRNSLVVESIKMTLELKPKYFVYENVKAFLGTSCLDVDGKYKAIKDSIAQNLEGVYNILYKVVNFKDYGCPSSRTRTLVVGVRKDILDVSPFDIFPDKRKERTLREIIGHLPSLKEMGEISHEDIYHSFRKYNPMMVSWIENLKEGQGAFENKELNRRPFHVENGKKIFNVEKNGDKYTRQCWDKVAPCIHTRNDILASQNTIHPVDNRVFSIREVMLMMSVPEEFEWSDIPFEKLNKLPLLDKVKYLEKNSMNIRQNLGEAVPTIIFRQIASKIRTAIDCVYDDNEVLQIIKKEKIQSHQAIINFIRTHQKSGYNNLSKISEYANALRESNEAFYTRPNICFSVIKSLPDFSKNKTLRIMEPSGGVGNFIPGLINKYQDIPEVIIDVCDIDSNSLEIISELIKLIEIPANIKLNLINADYLKVKILHHYDIIVGNPPYKKLTGNTSLLADYKEHAFNKDTNNLFAFFIEKSLKNAKVVSLIVPKSLVGTPEFNKTREELAKHTVNRIIDFGEKGFKGVKIETIAFVVNDNDNPDETTVESFITSTVVCQKQAYVMDAFFPYWLLYRDHAFDSIAEKMNFGLFTAFRDRSITRKITKSNGKIRVLKSRNIESNKIKDIEGYDCYIDDASDLAISRFLNQKECVLVPNLTYNPRACFMPKNCIADGSVAILELKDKSVRLTKKDLAYYASKEFSRFYQVARNLGTRSLNIDSNSVFFFGKLKKE